MHAELHASHQTHGDEESAETSKGSSRLQAGHAASVRGRATRVVTRRARPGARAIATTWSGSAHGTATAAGRRSTVHVGRHAGGATATAVGRSIRTRVLRAVGREGDVTEPSPRCAVYSAVLTARRDTLTKTAGDAQSGLYPYRWVAGQIVVAVARLADAIGAADDDVGVLACAVRSVRDGTCISSVILIAFGSQ